MDALLGITTTVLPEAGVHRRPEVVLYSVYARVFEAMGLISVLLTPTHSRRSLRALLSRCGGLVLTGGEDIEPLRYGASPVPELGRINPARDEMELTVLECALELDLPILGICRGCQLLNVYFGGTLYQDLNTQRPGELRHMQREPWGMRTHLVRTEPGSRLQAAVGPQDLLINSYHHQGIREVAAALRVVARATDGLIEGLEAPDCSWVVGVQWHPERHEATAPETDPDRLLLSEFADVVQRRAGVQWAA